MFLTAGGEGANQFPQYQRVIFPINAVLAADVLNNQVMHPEHAGVVCLSYRCVLAWLD